MIRIYYPETMIAAARAVEMGVDPRDVLLVTGLKRETDGVLCAGIVMLPEAARTVDNYDGPRAALALDPQDVPGVVGLSPGQMMQKSIKAWKASNVNRKSRYFQKSICRENPGMLYDAAREAGVTIK